MNAQQIQLQPLRVVMIRHIGPYDGIGPVFDQLWTWVSAHNVPVQKTIGIYYDNPDEVPANRLRSAACVEIPADYQVTQSDGLPLMLDQIAGGNYVTLTYTGPYEGLAAQWTALTSQIESVMRLTIREDPAFEVYVNDPSDTPPSQLVTELYMPVQ